jgi:hypothetical protein
MRQKPLMAGAVWRDICTANLRVENVDRSKDCTAR